MTSTAEYDALTTGGLAVELRPFTAGDADEVRELIEHLSGRSSYQRFFTVSTRAGADYVRRLLDPAHTLAAVVVVARGAIAAVGSLHPCGSGVVGDRAAEIGLLVADSRQGQGVGTLVVEDLLARALVAGLDSVEAVVLADNIAMLKVFTDSGFISGVRTVGNEVEVRCRVSSSVDAGNRGANRQATAESASLDHVLAPTSIAVVGAGRNVNSVGHQVLDHLVRAGFTGSLFAVNPQAVAVGDVPGFAHVQDIPVPVDLAVVAVRSAAVPGVARDCAVAGVRALLTLSAGFGEAGVDGAGEQASLLRICREAGMRLVGPNCIGVANTDPAVRLDATFLPTPPPAGGIGLLSQSGAATVGLLDAFHSRGAGLSSLVTVGNKADIGGNDVLPWWQHDARTRVIAAYLESIAEPAAFARVAGSVTATTPLVLLKAGRSAVAAAAATSHTAAAADDDAAVDALCRTANIIRVNSLRELADVAALASTQALPRGARVAIVGNSGGPAVLAADACATYGLRVTHLSASTQEHLRAILPPASAVSGPVDVTAAATLEQVQAAMIAVAADPEVDVVLAVLTVLGHLPPAALASALDQVTRSRPEMTVAACVFGAGDSWACSVPRFDQPEDAVRSTAALRRYLDRRLPVDGVVAAGGDPIPAAVRDELAAVVAHRGEGWLRAEQAYRVLKSCGIASAPWVAADDPETAEEGCDLLTGPFAVKADGPDLVHKSDVGAVRLGLAGPREVGDAVRDMQHRIGDAMTGVIVQTQVHGGTEIIIGATRVPRFGVLVMVGRGGVDSDVDPDRSWCLGTVDHSTAETMLRDLRSFPGLQARRGHAAADVPALADVLVRISALMAAVPEIGEIDLNPVLARPEGPVVVDVRIRVRPAPEPQLLDHVRHLRSAAVATA